MYTKNVSFIKANVYDLHYTCVGGLQNISENVILWAYCQHCGPMFRSKFDAVISVHRRIFFEIDSVSNTFKCFAARKLRAPR